METTSVADGSNYVVRPLNTTLGHVTYKFKVRVIDTRGTTLDTTEYTLVVLETPAVFVPDIINYA